MDAKKGDWVQIYFIGLKPEERPSHLPEDTRKVPLEVRIRGFLLDEEAEKNDIVKIETSAGRVVEGKLVAINPMYEHGFGEPVPELLWIGKNLRRILEGDEK